MHPPDWQSECGTIRLYLDQPRETQRELIP